MNKAINSYDVNFAKEETDFWIPTDFMFDLASVMLYDSYAGSTNEEPSMTLKGVLAEDGSAKTFSETARASTVDILEIQVLQVTFLL